MKKLKVDVMESIKTRTFAELKEYLWSITGGYPYNPLYYVSQNIFLKKGRALFKRGVTNIKQ